MDARAVDWEGLLHMLPFLSKSTIERQMRDGDFPKPREFSDRRVGWLVAEVDAWIAKRPVSEIPPPENTGAKKPRAARQAAPA
jgi:prophage regulatory protein